MKVSYVMGYGLWDIRGMYYEEKKEVGKERNRKRKEKFD